MRLKKFMYMIDFPMYPDEYIDATLKIASIIGSIMVATYTAKRTNLITGIMSGICALSTSIDISEKIYEKIEDMHMKNDGFYEQNWEEEFNQSPLVQHMYSVKHMINKEEG